MKSPPPQSVVTGTGLDVTVVYLSIASHFHKTVACVQGFCVSSYTVYEHPKPRIIAFCSDTLLINICLMHRSHCYVFVHKRRPSLIFVRPFTLLHTKTHKNGKLQIRPSRWMFKV